MYERVEGHTGRVGGILAGAGGGTSVAFEPLEVHVTIDNSGETQTFRLGLVAQENGAQKRPVSRLQQATGPFWNLSTQGTRMVR